MYGQWRKINEYQEKLFAMVVRVLEAPVISAQANIFDEFPEVQLLV